MIYKFILSITKINNVGNYYFNYFDTLININTTNIIECSSNIANQFQKSYDFWAESYLNSLIFYSTTPFEFHLNFSDLIEFNTYSIKSKKNKKWFKSNINIIPQLKGSYFDELITITKEIDLTYPISIEFNLITFNFNSNLLKLNGESSLDLSLINSYLYLTIDNNKWRIENSFDHLNNYLIHITIINPNEIICTINNNNSLITLLTNEEIFINNNYNQLIINSHNQILYDFHLNDFYLSFSDNWDTLNLNVIGLDNYLNKYGKFPNNYKPGNLSFNLTIFNQLLNLTYENINNELISFFELIKSTYNNHFFYKQNKELWELWVSEELWYWLNKELFIVSLYPIYVNSSYYYLNNNKYEIKSYFYDNSNNTTIVEINNNHFFKPLESFILLNNLNLFFQLLNNNNLQAKFNFFYLNNQLNLSYNSLSFRSNEINENYLEYNKIGYFTNDKQSDYYEIYLNNTNTFILIINDFIISINNSSPIECFNQIKNIFNFVYLFNNIVRIENLNYFNIIGEINWSYIPILEEEDVIILSDRFKIEIDPENYIINNNYYYPEIGTHFNYWVINLKKLTFNNNITNLLPITTIESINIDNLNINFINWNANFDNLLERFNQTWYVNNFIYSPHYLWNYQSLIPLQSTYNSFWFHQETKMKICEIPIKYIQWIKWINLINESINIQINTLNINIDINLIHPLLDHYYLNDKLSKLILLDNLKIIARGSYLFFESNQYFNLNIIINSKSKFKISNLHQLYTEDIKWIDNDYIENIPLNQEYYILNINKDFELKVFQNKLLIYIINEFNKNDFIKNDKLIIPLINGFNIHPYENIDLSFISNNIEILALNNGISNLINQWNWNDYIYIDNYKIFIDAFFSDLIIEEFNLIKENWNRYGYYYTPLNIIENNWKLEINNIIYENNIINHNFINNEWRIYKDFTPFGFKPDAVKIKNKDNTIVLNTKDLLTNEIIYLDYLEYNNTYSENVWIVKFILDFTTLLNNNTIDILINLNNFNTIELKLNINNKNELIQSLILELHHLIPIKRWFIYQNELFIYFDNNYLTINYNINYEWYSNKNFYLEIKDNINFINGLNYYEFFRWNNNQIQEEYFIQIDDLIDYSYELFTPNENGLLGVFTLWNNEFPFLYWIFDTLIWNNNLIKYNIKSINDFILWLPNFNINNNQLIINPNWLNYYINKLPNELSLINNSFELNNIIWNKTGNELFNGLVINNELRWENKLKHTLFYNDWNINCFDSNTEWLSEYTELTEFNWIWGLTSIELNTNFNFNQSINLKINDIDFNFILNKEVNSDYSGDWIIKDLVNKLNEFCFNNNLTNTLIFTYKQNVIKIFLNLNNLKIFKSFFNSLTLTFTSDYINFYPNKIILHDNLYSFTSNYTNDNDIIILSHELKNYDNNWKFIPLKRNNHFFGIVNSYYKTNKILNKTNFNLSELNNDIDIISAPNTFYKSRWWIIQLQFNFLIKNKLSYLNIINYNTNELLLSIDFYTGNNYLETYELIKNKLNDSDIVWGDNSGNLWLYLDSYKLNNLTNTIKLESNLDINLITEPNIPKYKRTFQTYNLNIVNGTFKFLNFINFEFEFNSLSEFNYLFNQKMINLDIIHIIESVNSSINIDWFNLLNIFNIQELQIQINNQIINFKNNKELIIKELNFSIKKLNTKLNELNLVFLFGNNNPIEFFNNQFDIIDTISFLNLKVKELKLDNWINFKIKTENEITMFINLEWLKWEGLENYNGGDYQIYNITKKETSWIYTLYKNDMSKSTPIFYLK